MTAYNSKFHIGLDSKGYILDRGGKAIYAYQKKMAPAFVNKFGSGDSSYRDANFWQFWAQINWRNGAKQEKWGDGGKFWKSSDVDVSQLEQLKLSKLLVSAGQVEAGAKITCQIAWRTSQNWWNEDYGYRKQLTITAPVSTTIPVGYPIKIDIDTAALQTASKVRSDRKDWRVVYWNGSTWVDLSRDYIDTTTTFFGTQNTISPGTTENNYYVYYGKSDESTSKQPTTDAEWNATYYPKIDDTYCLALWHCNEGSGNTLVDSDSTNDQTIYAGSSSWINTGQFGRAMRLYSSQAWKSAATAELTVGSFSLQFNAKFNSANGDDLFLSDSPTSDGTQFRIRVNSNGTLNFNKWVSGADENQTTSVAVVPDFTNWYNYAIVYDGAQTVKYYRNNVLITTSTFTTSGMRGNATSFLKIGADNLDLYLQHIRYDNVARTSFSGADIGLLTASAGTEATTQPPSSSFTLYVGTNTGKIYSWDGNVTWTLAYTATGSVNCAIITSVGGTQKALFGIGNLTSVTNAEAKIVSFDGTTWAVNKTFGTAPTESQVTSICEFSSKVYVGVGPQARVYETADLSTYTLSKDIDFPQKPGYVYVLKEYNSQLIAAGGSPEFLPTKNYGGFAFVYNGTLWQSLYPFDHTVIKSAEFYDAFLFFGTYHGQTYTYNTSYLDPLFSYRDDYNYLQQVSCQKYFDDKLFLGLYPQTDSNDTNIGLWVFERHGMSMLNSLPSSVTGITTIEQVNNILMIGTGNDGYIYKQDPSQYVATGWMQTSYYDANLPSIPKLWNQFTINHDPLITGTSIQVYYRFKESDAWVEIVANPIVVVNSTSTIYPFPNQVSSNKISFKIVLSTTNSIITPVIRETIMRYTLFPVVKYMWNLRIKCKSPMKLADETVDTRTGEEMRAELEALIEDPGLHTFVDIDGTSHTVLFHSIDEGSWVINQEDSSGATVPISLIEV